MCAGKPRPGRRGRVRRRRPARLPRQVARRASGAYRRHSREPRDPSLLRTLQQRHRRPGGPVPPPGSSRRGRLHLAAPRLAAALPRRAWGPAGHLLLHPGLGRLHRRPVQGVSADHPQVRRGEGRPRSAPHPAKLHTRGRDRDSRRHRPRRQARLPQDRERLLRAAARAPRGLAALPREAGHRAAR